MIININYGLLRKEIMQESVCSLPKTDPAKTSTRKAGRSMNNNSPSQLEDLGEALLDFPSVIDLTGWLNQHQQYLWLR
jgi:Domain of unknown function (DUF4351)